MLLDFDGTHVRVHVNREDSKISKHTGSTLSIVEVQATLRGQRENQEFLLLIDSAKVESIASIDENGSALKKWKVANNSWSYQDNNPVYFHTVQLEEVEEIRLESLTMGSLDVRPYKYEERFDGDALRIEARVLLSQAEHLALKAMQKSGDPFQVIRHGINEEPKQMGFGISYWSRHNEGFKHELMLIEEKAEEVPSRLGMALQWMRPMRNQVASNKVAIDALLNTLKEKGVLTADEATHIQTEAVERMWDSQYEFFRVEDVDE